MRASAHADMERHAMDMAQGAVHRHEGRHMLIWSPHNMGGRPRTPRLEDCSRMSRSQQIDALTHVQLRSRATEASDLMGAIADMLDTNSPYHQRALRVLAASGIAALAHEIYQEQTNEQHHQRENCRSHDGAAAPETVDC